MDISDIISIVLVVLCIGWLVYACNYQEQKRIQCEENGGIVINEFMSYQCITKEELQKTLEDDKK